MMAPLAPTLSFVHTNFQLPGGDFVGGGCQQPSMASRLQLDGPDWPYLNPGWLLVAKSLLLTRTSSLSMNGFCNE